MKFLFRIPALIAFCLLFISSCKKDNSDDVNTAVQEKQVLTDFANVVAYPNYQQIESNAIILNQLVQTLNSSSTETNLINAREGWKNLRASWEMCEAFIFGPVEDYNYDPMMDTWPVNQTDLDSLLASTNGLSPADITTLPSSLRGFHPLEYVLFGNGGSRTAASLTVREKEYMTSLSIDLLNTTTALRASWEDGSTDDFKNQLITAGEGSTRYEKRQDAFIAIAGAMAGICDEVANGKMEEPFAAQDSTLEESQFSHNSTTDFRNNIKGVENVYFCKFVSDGQGMNEIVAAKYLALDNKIKAQITAALSSFDAIDDNYGQAIYTQAVQIQNTQAALNDLKTTLETDLVLFIQTYIKD